MRETRGFTLVDLLMVIVLVVLVIMLLPPILQRKANESAKRAVCATRLHGVASAIALYTAENNDAWPWLDAANFQQASGAKYNEAPDPDNPAGRSITAALFLLVRNGQPAILFTCPSDDAVEDQDLKGDDGYYHWDFSPGDGPDEDEVDAWRHVSYSYQAPMYDSAGGTMVGSGVSNDSPLNLIIMADKTPHYDYDPQDSARRKFNAATLWTDNMDEEEMLWGVSQNHTGGEYINYLKADYSRHNARRADVGIAQDNIYSAAQGSDPEANRTQRSGGSLKWSDHNTAEDSFLVGPIKGK